MDDPQLLCGDPDGSGFGGLDCKLDAKLARNGLLNKAAALELDATEPEVVDGYDTDGTTGLTVVDPVEFARGT